MCACVDVFVTVCVRASCLCVRSDAIDVCVCEYVCACECVYVCACECVCDCASICVCECACVSASSVVYVIRSACAGLVRLPVLACVCESMRAHVCACAPSCSTMLTESQTAKLRSSRVELQWRLLLPLTPSHTTTPEQLTQETSPRSRSDGHWLVCVCM